MSVNSSQESKTWNQIQEDDKKKLQDEIANRDVAEIAKRCDEIIFRTKDGFLECGTALLQLQEVKGYKILGYKTFNECCEARYNLKRAYTYRLMDAVKITQEMSTIVDISNEGTAKEFKAVPKEDRPAVAEKAKTIASEKGRDTINSRDVKEAKAKIYSTEPKVTVIEPEPEAEPIVLPDEPEITMIQESAGEWIDSIPLFHELSGVPKRKFEESAKLWHIFEVDFKMQARRLRIAQKGIPSQFRSRFMSRQMSSFIVNSPEFWLKCKVCDGTGQIPQTGQCAMCSSDGFQITNYR